MKHDPTTTGPTIRLERDGPLIVSGLTNFTNSRGEPIVAGESVRLCRCGASKTKPYCDNTHVDIGFSDEKSDERVPDQLDRYEGEQVTIRDNRGICSHAGYCTSGLPEVWRSATGEVRDATSGYTLRKGERPSGDGDPGGTYRGIYNNDYEFTDAGDLDECNGMSIDRSYGYYVTDAYPWVIKCLVGVPDSSFAR